MLSPTVFETVAVNRARRPQHQGEVGKKFNLRPFYIGIGSMKIKVQFIPRNTWQDVEICHGATVSDLLRSIQLRPDAFIVLRKNTPIPIDEILDHDEELCLLQVASGG